MSTRQLRSATRSASGTLGFKQSKSTLAVPEKSRKSIPKPPSKPAKRPRSASTVDFVTTPNQLTTARVKDDKASNLKRQKVDKYPPGTTPYPDHPHPTPAESQNVVELLSGLHGMPFRPSSIPLPDLLVAGCGEVPSVLDALIRTLLSANTSAQNSSRAFRGLVEKFGVCGKRGSVDWEKVRKARPEEVFDAIKSGGLANVKSKRIQKLLQQVWEESQSRKKERRAVEERKRQEGKEDSDSVEELDIVVERKTTGEVIKQDYFGHQLLGEEDKKVEPTSIVSEHNNTELANYESDDDLSLDYLHILPDEAVLKKLISFDGIGLKTASCVLLFCMSRSSFAVDTHVFRLARFLNWVPPDKATRETAFWHLDAKLPDEHKYALHTLFIKHGRTCKWCKAGGPLKYEDFGKKKGNDKKIKEEGENEGGGDERGEDCPSSESEPDSKKQKVVMEEYLGPMPEKCPIEHLVKRFHGASKGRGVKWEE